MLFNIPAYIRKYFVRYFSTLFWLASASYLFSYFVFEKLFLYYFMTSKGILSWTVLFFPTLIRFAYQIFIFVSCSILLKLFINSCYIIFQVTIPKTCFLNSHFLTIFIILTSCLIRGFFQFSVLLRNWLITNCKWFKLENSEIKPNFRPNPNTLKTKTIFIYYYFKCKIMDHYSANIVSFFICTYLI